MYEQLAWDQEQNEKTKIEKQPKPNNSQCRYITKCKISKHGISKSQTKEREREMKTVKSFRKYPNTREGIVT